MAHFIITTNPDVTELVAVISERHAEDFCRCLFLYVCILIKIHPLDMHWSSPRLSHLCPHVSQHVVLAEAHRSLTVLSQYRTWQQSAAEHSRVVFILLDVYFAL